MKNYEGTIYYGIIKKFESLIEYVILNHGEFIEKNNLNLFSVSGDGVSFLIYKKNILYFFKFRFDTGYRGESLELVDVELHEGDNFHSLLRLVNNAYKEYPNLASAAINIGVGKGGRDITVQNLIYEFLFPIIGIEKP